MANPTELDGLLEEGAEKARALADPKVLEMKERLGFLPGRS